MFSNVLDYKVYIQEVTDPATGKHYNLHINSCVPDSSPLAGFICNEFYLTTPDPHCDVLVGIGKQAYADDQFDTIEEMTAALEEVIQSKLPEGFKRFEAIMNSGIKGNELVF